MYERKIDMKFRTEEAKEKFLHDEAFWENNESYCLGDTMEEAGDIIKVIMERKEQTYVGMDNSNA